MIEMELIVVGLVLVMIVMASLASVGWDLFEMRNRETWWWTCLLLIEAAVVPNPYLGAVLALFTLGLFQIGRSWFILRGIVIPVAGLAGAYLAILPSLTVASVAPILWGFVAVGVALGLWGVLGVYKSERPWTITAPPSWFGLWGVYEHTTGQMRHICGQGNTLHLVSIASLTLTAAVGLVWMGHWGAWFAIPFCLTPMVLVWLNQTDCHNVRTLTHPGQNGWNLCVLAMGVSWLAWPIFTMGLLCVLAVFAALAWVVYRPWERAHTGIDSGRLAYWKDAIQLAWWPAGWKVRLVGFGTSTWFLSTVRMAERRGHINVFTTAHNEYVQCLVEHGVIGLGIVGTYLAEALWRTSQAGPEGQAVFLLGLMVCGIAAISFPWTFFHEYHPSNTTEEQWYGSPTLNMLCFVVAVLVDLF